jgi:hypothetical protein
VRQSACILSEIIQSVLASFKLHVATSIVSLVHIDLLLLVHRAALALSHDVQYT